MKNTIDTYKINSVIDQILDFVDLQRKGILVVDNHGKIIKYNDTLLEIFGLDGNKSEKSIERAIKEQMRRCGIQKKDDFLRDQEKNQVNVNYKAMEVMETVYDAWLFERVSTEDLKTSILENIVRFGQDGIHAVDMDGKMILYNEAQGRIDHLNPKEVLGKHAMEIYALDEETSLLLRVLKTKESIETLRQTYYTTKGAFVDCVTSVIPLYYHDKMVGSVAIVRDYYHVLTTLQENQKVHSKERHPKYSEKQTRYTFQDIFTVDKDFKRNIEMAKLAAETNSNVLIIGETGTGKEMFAQSIHDYSL